MPPVAPDVDALLRCSAQWVGDVELSASRGKRAGAFLQELLHKPQSSGGIDAWGSYLAGLIARTELRGLVMAHLSSWLAHDRGVPHPSYQASPTLEQAFDRALLPRHYGAETARKDVVAAIERIAKSEMPGVLMRLEVDPNSLHAERETGLCDSELESSFMSGADQAARVCRSRHWTRAAWACFEFAVEAPSETVAVDAMALIKHLSAPGLWRPSLNWRAILIPVVSGDPARVLRCDPNYDLVSLRGAFVAVAEPYRGDDWQNAQRYPITNVIWRGS